MVMIYVKYMVKEVIHSRLFVDIGISTAILRHQNILKNAYNEHKVALFDHNINKFSRDIFYKRLESVVKLRLLV